MPTFIQVFFFYVFAIIGRAEIIRMLFSYAGVKFTEKRVEFSEWAGLKPTFPFESLPVLDVTEKAKTVRLGQGVRKDRLFLYLLKK